MTAILKRVVEIGKEKMLSMADRAGAAIEKADSDCIAAGVSR
jgi:hypothetical protein